MAEPTTTSTSALAAGIGLAALMPGIDGNALIGAFAGATLFVVSAKKLALWERAAYLAVSVALGYVSAPEIRHWLPVHSSGVAAFTAAACGITLTLGLIEACKRFDFAAWLSRKGGPRA